MHYVNYINIWIIYLHGFCDGVSINVDYIFFCYLYAFPWQLMPAK